MYPAYPYHNNPIPIQYAPNVNPTAKATDRGIPNLPYYPWPSGCNHCYSIPQSCCNHSYFGGPYSFTPHYPHYPPPPPPPPSPPFHTHGFYPPFTGVAGAHHPAYSFPPPHYSTEQPRYDYDKNTPTAHHCCGCEKKSTIKPQEPEVDTKTSEPLVPFLKDCPYPVMWVPSSYMNTQSNAKEKEKESHSHDPVLKLLEPSKKGENDERAPDHQGEGSNRFPFPIFWLPSKNNEVKKDMKEEKLDEKTKKDEAESFPIFWLPSKNNEVDMKEENNLDEKKRKKDEAESEKSSKNGVQKVIPVKQLGTPQKDQEKSSQKTSKLPPVCLRIDPLPKKKNSSRSPSPSGDKKRSKVSTIEDSKACNKQETESSSEGLKNDSKKGEKDNVVDEGAKMEKRKKLSENEAALMIQAVYRGFEVRKSQPLMKLRQIGEVGKQVVELRNRIQELESSSIDGKQKLVIGETLMSLLLKLDTIQGLHPVARDVRKSVAKELVGLQEKLDSLTIVKESETQSKPKTTSADEDQTPTQPESAEQASEPLNNDVAVNLQRQLELQNEDNTGELNNDQMELDQPVDHEKAQSDSNDETVRLDLDDHEAEAANPTLDMKTEYPVDQSSGELNNDRVQMAVETEQPVDDVIQEKFDQAQAQPGETVESDECERDGSTEARDMNLEPQVESEGKQSLVEITGDQLETVDEIEPLVEGEKSDLVLENVDSNEVDGGEKHSIVELTGDQTEMVEEKEKSDPREALILENVDNMEDPATGTVEVETDFGAVETMELGKEDVDQEEATVVDDVEGGCKEVLIEDLEGDPPLSATRSHVSSGGDMKVMEENEKLRVAVEELMKAGNEQVSVIKELTGRVKDLEKKLSKKKRKVKRSSRRPRGSIVEEVCVV